MPKRRRRTDDPLNGRLGRIMSRCLLLPLHKALRAVETAASCIGAATLLSVMLIVSADVAMRYVINRPFGWAYDLISLYLLGGLFYSALADTFANGGHISVQVIQYKLPQSVRHACQVAIGLVAAAFFTLLAALGASRAWTDYVGGSAEVGEIAWPTWIPGAVMAVGAAMLTLRLLLHAALHLTALLVPAFPADLAPLDNASEPRAFE